MASTSIGFADEGPVRVLIIGHPATRNAMTSDDWLELSRALVAFESSSQRVLVLRGEGDDFCSGAHLDDSMLEGDLSTAATTRFMEPVTMAASALHRMTKPTIAAVDGVAAGAGMNLALGCDIVLCSDRARFSEIFVRRGLTMDFGGSWLLPRLVGHARAVELALTGRMVGSEEAVSIGLALEKVPAEDLHRRAVEMAAQLAEGPPLAQQFIKRALDRSSTMTFEQATAFEATSQSILLASDDFREGVASFMERRPPHFRGS